MKAWRNVGLVALLLIVAGVLWLRWKAGEPRRHALQTLGELNAALRTGNSADLLNSVCLPAAIQGRTAPEQAEFLTKALADEISPEGLAVLQREGTFGSLTNLFPREAENWAKQAGVRTEGCVAFRLERNGLRAEVVLAKEQEDGGRTAGDRGLKAEDRDRRTEGRGQAEQRYRIVRLNNVKQLAQTQISTANSHP